MADKVEFVERLMFLDFVSVFARDGFNPISELSSDRPRKPKSALDRMLDAAVLESADWDLMLRLGNSWYDRMAAACRKPTQTERSVEFFKLEKEMKAMQADASDWKLSVLLGSSRQVVSKKIGTVLLGMLVPGISAARNTEDRGAMQLEVNKLGFALAAYRAEHRTYPERLAELAPQYLAKVPVDIFANDGPLHYKRQAAGYLLYSVGINGKDDGGRGYNDRKEGEDCDDISLRVP